ncbi:hypothetical protein ACFLRN_06845 [Thermoproteota archaeon]
MKEQMNYYKHYEKFMKMNLEQSIVKTSEYRDFVEIYPHITESIRLKREIERLTKKMKSEKERSGKIKIKKEINNSKTKLRKNDLFKRLHGESKQESKFQRTYKLSNSKMRVSSFIKKPYIIINNKLRNLQKKKKNSMYRHLPPTIFNLRELDVTEKGLVLREWLHEKRKKNH